jgi:hypothetical protein
METKRAVFGIFVSRGGAEGAILGLKDAGFSSSDVAILLPESLSRDIGTEKATKGPEGVTAGAGTGAVIGGVLGWLVGVGSIAIPGVGPFIAAGPLVAALAGMGVGGTVGGLAGGFIGLGIPEYEAKRYEGRIREGGILVSVHCDSTERIDRARAVLVRSGAQDVSSASEAGVREADRVSGTAPGR